MRQCGQAMADDCVDCVAPLQAPRYLAVVTSVPNVLLFSHFPDRDLHRILNKLVFYLILEAQAMSGII